MFTINSLFVTGIKAVKTLIKILKPINSTSLQITLIIVYRQSIMSCCIKSVKWQVNLTIQILQMQKCSPANIISVARNLAKMNFFLWLTNYVSIRKIEKANNSLIISSEVHLQNAQGAAWVTRTSRGHFGPHPATRHFLTQNVSPNLSAVVLHTVATCSFRQHALRLHSLFYWPLYAEISYYYGLSITFLEGTPKDLGAFSF